MNINKRHILRILVADQHPLFKAGIKTLLTQRASWQQFQVDEAETTEEVFAILASEVYTVVLIDYNLPGRGGVKATEIIMSRWPATCILALTNSDDGPLAERIVNAGARGCILRNLGPDTLISAIQTVITGKRYYSNEIAQQLLQYNESKLDPMELLTNREKQVFMSILAGVRDKDIAARMGISKRTVEKHRQHLNYKLGTRTPLELIQAGLRMGLIKMPD